MDRRSFFRRATQLSIGGAALVATAAVAQVAPPPKKVVHLEVGDETWEPTQEELNTLIQMFQRAERDPLGGWIATRHGVKVTVL